MNNWPAPCMVCSEQRIKDIAALVKIMMVQNPNWTLRRLQQRATIEYAKGVRPDETHSARIK